MADDEREEVITEPIAALHIPDRLPDRMRSGITAREAMSRAAKWWDTVGMLHVKRSANFDIHAGDIVVKSRILLGQPWDSLNKRERFQVIRCWHDTFAAQQKGTLIDERQQK